jgi:SAM-dependent methyltransferase
METYSDFSGTYAEIFNDLRDAKWGKDNGLEFILRKMADPPYKAYNWGTKRALDVCCGTGRDIQKFVDITHSRNISGTDISTDLLDIAKKELGGDIKLAKADLCKDSLAGIFKDRFDFAYCLTSFELLPDPRKAVENLFGVMKPLSTFVFDFWNYDAVRAMDAHSEEDVQTKAHGLVHRTKDVTREGRVFTIEYVYYVDGKSFKVTHIDRAYSILDIMDIMSDKFSVSSLHPGYSDSRKVNWDFDKYITIFACRY